MLRGSNIGMGISDAFSQVKGIIPTIAILKKVELAIGLKARSLP
jgi:hypothetical protein